MLHWLDLQPGLLHIICTLAGDAPLLLGISDRRVPTLPYHYAMGSDEQSSVLLTLVCSLLVSMTLIVSILVRSDTSIGCMKNSWREFLYHNSLAQSGKMTNCHLSSRRLFVVNSSIHTSHVTQENEGSDEENFAWASSMQIIEEDSSSSSSLPSITFNGCLASFDSTFALLVHFSPLLPLRSIILSVQMKKAGCHPSLIPVQLIAFYP